MDPAWEARSDWGIFRGIAQKFSEVAPEVLGVEHEVVLSPILHDTPIELAQPYYSLNWAKGECDAIPGKTMPNVHLVERSYPEVFARFTSFGPDVERFGNGSKGISWDAGHEVAQLGDLNGQVLNGRTAGRSQIETDIDACETILMLPPETKGEVALKAWNVLLQGTGREHAWPRARRRRSASATCLRSRARSTHRRHGRASKARMSLQRWLDQRQRTDSLANAVGAAAALPGSPLDAGLRRSLRHMEASDRHQQRGSGAWKAAQRQQENHAELPDPASEMGYPFDLYRKPQHAEPGPRKPYCLDQRGGRPRGGHCGQRLDRGLQHERRADRAGVRQPADHASCITRRKSW